MSSIRRRFVFGEPGMQRREIPEIPREAVREGGANALCHRDYTTGTAVEVNVYMDFVEVVSPGLFPEGDAPENHLAGGDGGLKQRNPGASRRRSSARERSSSTARASPASSGTAMPRA